MEKSSKRGKIPQQDWPEIIKRYESGETLASIARTYDCSPPAISYIVSRSRARNAAGEGVAGEGVKELLEPMVEGHPGETPPSNASQGALALAGVREEQVDPQGSRAVGPSPEEVQSIETSVTIVEQQRTPDQPENPLADRERTTAEQPGRGYDDTKPEREDGSVALRSADTTQNGGHRRTLHLGSLSQSGPLSDRPNQDSSSPYFTGSGGRVSVSTPTSKQPELEQHGRQTAAPSTLAPVAINGPASKTAEVRGVRDGAFIDQALRERVDNDIAVFLEAFDAALAHDTLDSRAGLREATDRLLRAGARTRIELERLEARVPLPPRDNGTNAPSAWRPR